MTKRETFATSIYKILKSGTPDFGMSKRGMSAVNAVVIELFDRIAREAVALARHGKRQTVTEKDVIAAVRIIFPEELQKHAVSEMAKAVARYQSAQ